MEAEVMESLRDDFLADERGELTAAFDGELGDALRSLGRALAQPTTTDQMIDAVYEFRSAVDLAADQYAMARAEACRG